MNKRLRVNTGIMDMISTKPEAIEAYDEIRINCGLCLTTAKTRQLLAQGKISINTANIYDVGVADEVESVVIAGVKKVTAKFSAPEKPTVLIINGALIIEDSDKKNLDQYVKVVINGVVLHPMSFDTSNFDLNGALIPYPDGATLILQELELTNSFIKSAVPGTTYFVQGIPSNISGIGKGMAKGAASVLKNTGIRAVEPLDLEALKSKNIRFYTGWVTALEENAEQLMKMVDGCLGNTVIPSGYSIMQGGRLDKLALRRFGKRIYVDGDLEIREEDAEVLAAVEHLVVEGKVRLADSIADIFFEKCTKYGKLTVYQGEWMDISRTEYTLNKELLEESEKGITFNIVDSSVEIAPDVTAELLLEKIHEIFLHHSTLTISLSQQNALRKLVRNNEGNITIREYESKKQSEPAPVKKDYIETKINSSYYKL